jgi:putative ABC transport system permease protein
VVEVTPNVSGRLPIETVNRLHAEVAGAEAVIPIVAGLTPVDVPGGSHGFFLLGGSCQIELLVGSFNCEQRARDEKPADGPGVPLEIPTVIAQRHGLQLSEELRIPGLPPGSAHLGSTFPEFDRVEGINDGYVCCWPCPWTSPRACSPLPVTTAAFVLPKKGTEITAVTADVDRVIAGVATAGPPRPHFAGHIRRRHTESQPDRAGRHPHRRPHRREHDPAGRGGPAGGDGNDRRDRRKAGWVVRRDAR